MLFEDRSDDLSLLTKTIKNTTDFDFLSYLIVENIADPASYFDANKVLKLRDKLSPDCGKVLEMTVKRFKSVTKTFSPQEFIK